MRQLELLFPGTELNPALEDVVLSGQPDPALPVGNAASGTAHLVCDRESLGARRTLRATVFTPSPLHEENARAVQI